MLLLIARRVMSLPRSAWLTAERQSQLRSVLLGTVLFLGLAVWVGYSTAVLVPRPADFTRKLRVVGIMTWLYALVQLLDMRFWHSAAARRRQEQMGVPESLLAWLFGQMLAWFGIVYFGVTNDLRWYVAGMAVLLVTFAAFPIQKDA